MIVFLKNNHNISILTEFFAGASFTLTHEIISNLGVWSSHKENSEVRNIAISNLIVEKKTFIESFPSLFNFY